MVGRATNKCEFCQGDGWIEDEYGEWKLEEVTLTPLPAINLTTREVEPASDEPYHALFLKYIDEEYGSGEHGSFPINFCPVCGRQLNENYPSHWEGGKLVLSKDAWKEFEAKQKDPETIRRRNKFFAALDAMKIKKNEDGSMEVPFEPKPKDKIKNFAIWARCKECAHMSRNSFGGVDLCSSPVDCVCYDQFTKKEK